jgi:alpha-beta hydrolase superfamily lysophospholipase
MQTAKAIKGTPEMTEQTFKGVGGLNIFARSWRPAAAPRGVVVIAHGFNSHSGQYDWVAEQFLAAGLAVHAIDHRGRGKSEGERFHVETSPTMSTTSPASSVSSSFASGGFPSFCSAIAPVA